MLQKIIANLLLFAVLFSACNHTNEKIEVDEAFAAYISGYTTGIVSKNNSIVIKFTKKYGGDINPLEELDDDLLEFSPSLDGKLHWVNPYTLEFVPEESMKSNQVYTGTLQLSDLYEVEDGFEKFQFQFTTIKQDFTVRVEGLRAYSAENLKKQYLEGNVLFADDVDTTQAYKLLHAKQLGADLKVTYTQESSRLIHFKVDSVTRAEDESVLLLSWDGDVVDVDDEDSYEVKVPAIGDFKVSQVRVIQSPGQFVEVRFSDPLSQQDLNGFIQIQGTSGLRFTISENIVRVYPPNRLAGEKKVSIASGIKNSEGYKLQKPYSQTMRFEQIKPDIKLVNKGVIMPNSNGLIFPFEAVSLSHVDVYISRIFSNNVLQFFQSDSWNDSYYNIRRVGRVVHKEQIDLSTFGKSDLNVWNRYFLDLSKVMQVEPGALYEVDIRFKKPYSLYTCEGNESNTESIQLTSTSTDEWDESDNYWISGDDYNWRENENPCNSAYYGRYESSERQIVFGSDLGVMAKLGQDKKMFVAVNNLLTTQPVSGATVEIYDYQQQLITQKQTDADGFVLAELSRRPYFVVVKHDNQVAYLTVKSGESLSTSKFDVSGAASQKGVKGFLYGERGVWRPGDSLYLTFILEDKNNLLPAQHPVLMELKNPQGKLVKKIVSLESSDGFYSFKTATDVDDITGYYSATVKVGNRRFEKTLRIETVKPNRLKILLDFDADELYEADDLSGKLAVKWLHGATAGNLKAKVDLKLLPTSTSFKGYPNYVFDNPSVEFSTEETTIFDGQLNSDGEASISLADEQFSRSPGKLRASLSTKAFEPGGDFSIDHYNITVSPYTSYVGVRIPKGTLWDNGLETDKDHIFEIATVTEKGKPVDRKDLLVEVFKIDWNWWWDSYSRNIADYIARYNVVPLSKKKVSTANGKVDYTFRINQPNWGRYFVRVSDPVSGHSAGKIFYMDWPYWARSSRVDAQNASMLGFSADKETYQVGESVKVTFPSPKNGRALVCVENGSQVIEKYWVETTEGETKFDFEVTVDMTPNVFVNIALLQPHANTLNDRPIRSYGILPIGVENPETHLKPTIKTDDVFRPETKVKVTVGEENHKPMTYTLAIVDEGLLDLTRFKTPNPWYHFYAREALGVSTWDMYDDVIGAYGGKLDKMLAIGGDGEVNPGEDRKANRFEPMLRFVGPFQLDGGDENTHEIDVPNYVGSVRVMVVAGKDAAYGNAEKAIPVRKPLMVLATLPRVLSPHEEIDLPVSVFAMEDHVKKADVKVTVSGPASLDSPAKQTVTFDKVGDELVRFKLKTEGKTGIVKVRVEANGAGEKSYHEIEIDVRAPNPVITHVKDTVLQPGAEWTYNLDFFGIAGTQNAAIEVSRLPSLGLEDRLRYLIQYPHGCVEQTTSSVFPQLFLSTLTDVDEAQQSQIQNNVQQGINRLIHFQTASGGFAYWPGQPDASEWGSNYAGHFILEAEKKGYALPIGMKKSWVKYQQEVARNWGMSYVSKSSSDQLMQAYRLYTLALAGQPEVGSMNRMRELPNIQPNAAWRLAAAYFLIGQEKAAKQLIEGKSYHVEPYTELYYTYGSGLRDMAMILEVMTLMDNRNDGMKLSKDIVERLNDRRWWSTQTTAYVLLSMSKFLSNDGIASTMTYSVTAPGISEKVNTEVPVQIHQLKPEVIKSGELANIKNTSNGVIYVQIAESGIPLEDKTDSRTEGVLSMEVTYMDMDNNTFLPTPIAQGTDFIVRVKVSNHGARGDLHELALSQLVPSGWEIINSRLAGGSTQSGIEYQDIRDDRVYTYFDLPRNQSKVFDIQVNATYSGKYYLPAIYCEAMYDETIQAKKGGMWIVVK